MADPENKTQRGGENKGGAPAGVVPGATSSKEEMAQVPMSMLVDMQKQMATMEIKDAERDAEVAGMKLLLEEANKGVDSVSEPALRKKKSFEPKFRTIKLRKYPKAGDQNNLGYVVGWTDRGAYEEIASNGITAEKVLFIDIVFAGDEYKKDANGEFVLVAEGERKGEKILKAEKVRYLDFLNNSNREHFKIIETKREEDIVPSGEEIDVTIFDPQHGLVSTGEKIDGYIVFSDVHYKIQIPGINGGVPFWIDQTYCN